MARRRPLADKDAVLDWLRANPDRPNSEAARVLGANKDSVARWRREAGIPNPYAKYDAHGVSESVQDMAGPEPLMPIISWDEMEKSGLWKSMERYQHEVRRRDPRVEEASITVPDNAPVLLIYTSDWHLGHLESRMDVLRRDLEVVARTPGVYLGAGGDLLDNTVSAVADRGMLFESMTPPQIQMYLVEEAAAIVPHDRWLFVCLGNHEAWSVNAADFDPMAHFAKHIDTAYFGAWGYLHITVGKYTYDILAGHKFSGNSKINKTGMVKNAMNMLGDADVVFAGHVHNYAVEESETRRRDRFFAVAGTYLHSSRYGRTLGYGNTSARMPGAVLFPNERKFIGTSDAFGQGIHILSSYRDDVVCECDHCRRRREAA